MYIKATNQLLILEYRRHDSQPTTHTERNDKRDNKIENDVFLIGQPCFAIILCAAALTFDMGEHVRANSASPPGVADLLRVALSTVGAGGILDWVLHKVPPEIE
jgi:hypothetical protein